ncbi:hypothetical protein [Dethiobacter alkaliphilus]|nr:hypothetical protein [Dethiobacter alkaliphilus]MCW3491011.1 hypothetical protein [Dethiobacter alkaliphilus]
MAECEKCNVEVKEDEVYRVNGVEMCEECSLKYQNPSKPCGGGPGSQTS